MGNKSIAALKDAIKYKKQNEFARIDADKLTLWKVSIPVDDNTDAILGDLVLEDNKNGIKLKNATADIFDIFEVSSEKFVPKNIHVIIQPPVTALTLLNNYDLIKEAVETLISKVEPQHKPHKANLTAVGNYQKKTLGDFSNPQKLLPYGFNEENLDLALFGQVIKEEPTPRLGDKRKLSEFIEIDSNKQYLIAMVARSGSGKTATVFSLAKKHFVIYVLCAPPDAFAPVDRNFETLKKEVSNMPDTFKEDFLKDHPVPNEREERSNHLVLYDEKLKERIGNRVELEFLARQLFLLLLFRKDCNLEPETFLREQINGGQNVIGELVGELRIYHENTIHAMLKIVSSKLDQQLGGRGLIVALDEAHTTGKVLDELLISRSAIQGKKPNDIFDANHKILSQYRRGFLTPLCTVLDGMSVTLIVLGTTFTLLNADRVCSNSSKPPARHIRITNFPSTNEKDVDTILTKLLDMRGCEIPPDKKRRLTGRCRYTTYMVEAIAAATKSPDKTKQQILDAAIEIAIKKAKNDAKSAVEKLNSRNTHLLCRMLIAFKLKDGHINFPLEEDADFLNEALCVLTEEDSETYTYSMKEPVIADAVAEKLEELKINPEFFEYFNQLNSIFESYGVTSSAKGSVFERLIGASLKRFNNMLIKDLPFVKNLPVKNKANLPAWCNTTTFRVDKDINHEKLRDDIEFFKNPQIGVGIYPHHLTGPDWVTPLAPGYWATSADKLYTASVNSSTNSNNTSSSDLRSCFTKSDGEPNQARKVFEDHLKKGQIDIKGTLRIHVVFPGVGKSTPQNEVEGEDLLIYIDIKNMHTLFDETIESGAKDMRTIKKMIRYMVSSKEELDQLMKGCGCDKTQCGNNQCGCRRAEKNCTEWCKCVSCLNQNNF